MRRTYLVVLLISCAVVADAQPSDPFRPEHPIAMGRGGSFTATAQGYNSFFSNPAGFARGGELTLASVNLWAFMDRELFDLARDLLGSDFGLNRGAGSRSVDADAYESLQEDFTELQEWIETTDPAIIESILQSAAADSGVTFEEGDDIAAIIAAAGTDDLVEFLLAFEAAAEAEPGSGYPAGLISGIVATIETALPSGYLRAGGQIGLGYAGNGIGLGLFAKAEATVDGTTILQAYGTAHNTITFVGGLGLTFGSLDLGVSVRPTILGYTRVNAAPILSSYLAGADIDLATMFTNTVYYGSGLGVDIGALLRLGPLQVGLAVRDLLGTQVAYRKSDFDTYSQALLRGSLPIGDELTPAEQEGIRAIPMKVNAGLQFHPDLGALARVIDPSVGIDLLDIISLARAGQEGEMDLPEQILSVLNVGAELRILRFLSLRGGYYGGYLAAGFGMRLFIFDVNAALVGDFGRDTDGSWGFSNAGGSVELAIRL